MLLTENLKSSKKITLSEPKSWWTGKLSKWWSNFQTKLRNKCSPLFMTKPKSLNGKGTLKYLKWSKKVETEASYMSRWVLWQSFQPENFVFLKWKVSFRITKSCYFIPLLVIQVNLNKRIQWEEMLFLEGRALSLKMEAAFILLRVWRILEGKCGESLLERQLIKEGTSHYKWEISWIKTN